MIAPVLTPPPCGLNAAPDDIRLCDRFLIAIEAGARSPHQWSSRQALRAALFRLNRQDIVLAAREPSIAEMLWAAAQVIADSDCEVTRDLAARCINLLKSAAWRPSQTPNPPPRRRADLI